MKSESQTSPDKEKIVELVVFSKDGKYYVLSTETEWVEIRPDGEHFANQGSL